MVKKFEAVFGGGEAIASAKKMLTIFVMVASLALVATLASVQIASAATGGGGTTPLPPCETVQITKPSAGSSLNGVVTMTGYAKYGSSGCTNYVSGSQLTWFVNGKNLGHGSSKSFDFSPYFVCQGVYIKLKAAIPSPFLNTISKTIVVHGSQPC